MPPEPASKRAYAFIDGQNLFYSARETFFSSHPNYDPVALSTAICGLKQWELSRVYFYTGLPDEDDNAFWNYFWRKKLAAMETRGVITFARPLQYRNQLYQLTAGQEISLRVGREKGIDVRIALDVVHLARLKAYDVALIFSQDQDLSEVADEVKAISTEQNRWIKVACAYPHSPTSPYARGINNTDWIRIDQATYEACIDPTDYRPSGQP